MGSQIQPVDSTVFAPAKVEPTLEVLKYKEELAAKMGLPSPYGMGLMKELAQDLVSSGMVPKHFSGNPMAVYGAALRGREMGFQPMESVLEVFFPAPGGNLGMYAKKMLQIMHEGGVRSKFLKEDADSCEILFTPPAPHEPYTARFAATEAQTAKLIREDSNWMKWRTDMNRARAISRGYRALLGTYGSRSTFGGYSKEEMEDSGMLDSTTGEPTLADIKRGEQLDAKYHVGLKSAAAAPPVSAEESVTATTAAPTPTQTARATVVEMPTPTTTTAPSLSPKVEYGVFWANHSGGPIVEVPNEERQSLPDTAKLRARALANTSNLPHYVYEIIDGVTASNPLMTAEPLKKAEPAPTSTSTTTQSPSAAQPSGGTAQPSPLKKRFLEAQSIVTKAVNNGLAEDKAIPEKTVAARVKTFLLGYFGVSKLADLPNGEKPGDLAIIDAAISDLESCAARDANVLLSAPEDAGKRMAKSTLQLAGIFNGELRWPVECSKLAMAVSRLRGMDHTDVIQFLEHVQLIKRADSGWKSADFSDIETSLRICLVTRNAGKFIRKCNEHNLSVAKMLPWMEERRFMGKKLAEVSTSDADSAIDWALKAIDEKVESETGKRQPPVKPQFAPPVQENAPQPAPAVSEDEDDLFEALP